MHIGEIAEKFIRAAEIERASHEHVGPGALRAQQLPYVHTFADKAGWRKEPGDKLKKGEDPLAEERRLFWERLGVTPSAQELTELEALYDWLTAVGNEEQRRALLAWARSKVGGKSFRRWCFQDEGIHPETGRRRKDRALLKISTILSGRTMQHSQNGTNGVLASGHEISDVSDTVEEDAGRRDGLNSWAADDAFTSFLADQKHDFSWAAKRNEVRRQKEARRKAAA